jgi:hypothetical protein
LNLLLSNRLIIGFFFWKFDFVFIISLISTKLNISKSIYKRDHIRFGLNIIVKFCLLLLSIICMTFPCVFGDFNAPKTEKLM